jgi:hypothetical protein
LELAVVGWSAGSAVSRGATVGGRFRPDRAHDRIDAESVDQGARPMQPAERCEHSSLGRRGHARYHRFPQTAPRSLGLPNYDEVVMPRRGGKAASRRSRQRKQHRQPQRPVPRAPSSPATPSAATPDVAEAKAPERVRGPVPTASALGLRSDLGPGARAQYHYVGRDLRNIAVLSLVMLILLLAAWAAANALNLTAG